MSMAWINSWNNSKYRLTYSIEQSPSWEANLFSASQEILHIAWNPQVHFAFTCASHLSLSCARPIQSMPSHPISWRSILILSFHLCLSFSGGLIPSGFPTKTLYTPLLSPIHATFPTHLILLDLPRTIFGDEYRSLSSSLCIFFTPLLPHPSWVQTLSWAPYSQTPSDYIPPLVWATKLHTHIKQQAKL